MSSFVPRPRSAPRYLPPPVQGRPAVVPQVGALGSLLSQLGRLQALHGGIQTLLGLGGKDYFDVHRQEASNNAEKQAEYQMHLRDMAQRRDELEATRQAALDRAGMHEEGQDRRLGVREGGQDARSAANRTTRADIARANRDAAGQRERDRIQAQKDAADASRADHAADRAARTPSASAQERAAYEKYQQHKIETSGLFGGAAGALPDEPGSRPTFGSTHAATEERQARRDAAAKDVRAQQEARWQKEQDDKAKAQDYKQGRDRSEDARHAAGRVDRMNADRARELESIAGNVMKDPTMIGADPAKITARARELQDQLHANDPNWSREPAVAPPTIIDQMKRAAADTPPGKVPFGAQDSGLDTAGGAGGPGGTPPARLPFGGPSSPAEEAGFPMRRAQVAAAAPANRDPRAADDMAEINRIYDKWSKWNPSDPETYPPGALRTGDELAMIQRRYAANAANEQDPLESSTAGSGDEPPVVEPRQAADPQDPLTSSAPPDDADVSMDPRVAATLALVKSGKVTPEEVAAHPDIPQEAKAAVAQSLPEVDEQALIGDTYSQARAPYEDKAMLAYARSAGLTRPQPTAPPPAPAPAPVAPTAPAQPSLLDALQGTPRALRNAAKATFDPPQPPLIGESTGQGPATVMDWTRGTFNEPISTGGPVRALGGLGRGATQPRPVDPSEADPSHAQYGAEDKRRAFEIEGAQDRAQAAAAAAWRAAQAAPAAPVAPLAPTAPPAGQPANAGALEDEDAAATPEESNLLRILRRQQAQQQPAETVNAGF